MSIFDLRTNFDSEKKILFSVFPDQFLYISYLTYWTTHVYDIYNKNEVLLNK